MLRTARINPGRRTRWRVVALTAAAGLVLAGCSDDGEASDDGSPSADPSATATGPASASPDPGAAGSAPDLPDPNEDIEDGVYRGAGVVLPVPEGWSLNAQARAQGIVAATSSEGNAQMTAQAIDREEASAAGQDVTFDSLLESLRSQAPGEPAVDESVELVGAERAHRLTFLDMPAQSEGAPTSSATIVIAESEQRVGEFILSSTSDAYDEATVDLLLAEAGFDPDSEPPTIPGPPTSPPASGEPSATTTTSESAPATPDPTGSEAGSESETAADAG